MAKRKPAKKEPVAEAEGPSSPNGSLNVVKAEQDPRGKKRKVKVLEDEFVDDINRAKRLATTVKEEVVVDEDPDAEEEKKVVKPANRSAKKKVKVDNESEAEVEAEKKAEKKVKKKRKTKEEKEAEAMPLAARTVGHRLFIGAHVSAAGGVHNAPINSLYIGANAFALFLKSQRKWSNPPLLDEHSLSFHNHCKSHTYDQASHVVPHGSYLVNLAHTDETRTEQAYSSFLDDLQRCEKLGIKLYNFHPGVANSVGGDRQAAIAHLAKNINRAHEDTSTVVTLLENMAHGGNTLGSTFEDLRDIIALTNDKKRVGVCLDTCHAFAGGYDLRTPAAFKATMDQFDSIVGVQYLRAVHMNDSKAPFASHRDLHQNIGAGFLGLRAFHNLVNDVRFEGIPLILETPIDAKDEDGNLLKDERGKDKEDKGIWANEIKLLESLVGMDVESEEFLKLEKALARKGEPERKKMSEQMEKKREKDAKKAEKSGTKKAKKGAKVKEKTENEESALSELESEAADDDHVGDTQRLAE